MSSPNCTRPKSSTNIRCGSVNNANMMAQETCVFRLKPVASVDCLILLPHSYRAHLALRLYNCRGVGVHLILPADLRGGTVLRDIGRRYS